MCKFCDADFSNITEVAEHMAALHGTKSNYNCEKCDFSHPLEHRLIEHKYQVHRPENITKGKWIVILKRLEIQNVK